MNNERKLASRLRILARMVEGTTFVAWARELREAADVIEASLRTTGGTPSDQGGEGIADEHADVLTPRQIKAL